MYNLIIKKKILRKQNGINIVKVQYFLEKHI